MTQKQERQEDLKELFQQDPREPFLDPPQPVVDMSSCDRWISYNPPEAGLMVHLDYESIMALQRRGVTPIEFIQVALQHGSFEITDHFTVGKTTFTDEWPYLVNYWEKGQ